MNQVLKSAATGPVAAPLDALRAAAAAFHSTPVSERKRKTHWSTGTSSFRTKRFNYYARRARKSDSKKTLLRDISEYADYLFQSWRNEDVPDDGSWFRREYVSKGTHRHDFGFHEPRRGSFRNRRFEFCTSDDDGVETIFHSAFGGDRFYYWSFNSSENFHSSYANQRSSWKWRYESDDESDSCPQSDFTSERRVLGLSASGPLKLEEIKSAYRACALRWHPDRHEGSSKVAAEEKFKNCSAAYQALCDSLATAAIA